MTNSTTYQKILREGRREGRREGLQEGRVLEARQVLLRLGAKRIGEPGAATVAVIEAIGDIDRLESLGLRLVDVDVHDWDDLLRGN